MHPNQLELDSDIPTDRDEMLGISTVAEASTDPGLGLSMVGLANGVVCPTPTAFRASVTANVTTHAAVCCAAETSANSLEALEDEVVRFVILAADLRCPTV